MSQLFQTFMDDSTSPQHIQQQEIFLQEGMEEQQSLKLENDRLKSVCAKLLRSRHLQTKLHPFADHGNRTEAEIIVKYHQTLSEIDQIRVDIAALQSRSDQEQIVLRTSLEEVERQKEEASVAFSLVRNAALTLQVRAFGVFLTDEQAQKLENDFTEQLELTEGSRLAQLEAQEAVNVLAAQTKSSSNLTDKLKIIDYEQIKIENQTLAEKIEERSEELLKLRRRTVSTLQILAHVREKRHFVGQQVILLERERASLDEQVGQLRSKLGSLKTDRSKKRKEADESRDQTGLSGNAILVDDYERRTQMVEQLHVQMGVLREKQAQLQAQYEELTKAIMRKQNGLEW
ncbi:hypothetical protein SS50377_24746 [Spironucleus salmonicida]|uniref:CCDC113/CCDC96 coiled-coil domain-containing protein n=1 Tax=Spironucleus salmonicida TaxID=348837 RepID=V6LLI6_9EUKA|nr:hypothetical protein SS50377_24746 [Spironucleus salmonicida]|eukprot:EST44626.1 hypothetical protein SS50377_15633 [Spironucleus salmonicida]